MSVGELVLWAVVGLQPVGLLCLLLAGRVVGNCRDGLPWLGLADEPELGAEQREHLSVWLLADDFDPHDRNDHTYGRR